MGSQCFFRGETHEFSDHEDIEDHEKNTEKVCRSATGKRLLLLNGFDTLGNEKEGNSNAGRTTMLFSLRKSQRIVSEADFGRVLSYKCFVCKGMMRLYAAENEIGSPRFGVSVSKSCGNAVMRNRFKRLSREAFRLHQHEIGRDFDYILIFTRKKPKKSPRSTESRQRPQYKNIERDFLSMVQMLERKLVIRGS